MARAHSNNTRNFVEVLQSIENVNKIFGSNNQNSLTDLLLNNAIYCECIKYMASLSIRPYSNFELSNRLKKIPMLLKYSHQTATLLKLECAII